MKRDYELSRCTLLLVLLLVFLMNLFAGDSPRHWITSNVLEIEEISTDEYPQIRIRFSNLFHGNPLRLWDQGFTNNIEVFENGRTCDIIETHTEAEPATIELNVLVYMKKVKEEELSKIQNVFSELKIRPVFYGYQASGFTRLPFKSLYNEATAQEDDQNFTRNLVRYFNDKLSVPAHNVQIHILVGRFKKIKNIEILNAKLAELANHKKHFYSILYKDKQKSFPDFENSGILERCIFIRDFDDELPDLVQQVQSAVDLIRGSYSAIKFKVRSILPGDTVRNYRLQIPIENEKMSATFPVHLPRRQMQSYFLEVYQQKATNLLNQKDYPLTLDTLKYAHRQLRDTIFSNLAEAAMKDWGAELLQDTSENNLQPFFRKAEYEWQVLPYQSAWYKKLKIELLRKKSKQLEKERAPLDARIDITKQLLILLPQDPALQLKMMVLQGQKSETEGNYWSAADSYHTGWKEFSSSSCKRDFSRCLSQAIWQSFRQGAYRTVIAQGDKYFSYLSGEFSYRYIWATSHLKLNNYSSAKKHFEWMLQHWKENQSLISWESAFEKLQNLYTVSLEFDNSFNLIKRIFRTKRDEEKRLPVALNVIRAKYLFPLIDALPVIYGDIRNSMTLGQFITGLPPAKYSDKLTGIFLTDSNGQLLSSGGNSAKFVAPRSKSLSSIRNFPAFLQDEKNAYLIQRMGNQFVILQFPAEVTDEEEIMLQAIQRNKLAEKPWYEIYLYCQENYLPVLSQTLTEMIGKVFSRKPDFNLKKYWAVFAPHGLFKYLVLHNSDGDVTQAANFTPSEMKYTAEDWQRSSLTPALYWQQAGMGSEKVLDYANPIYHNNLSQGVLRIGFKKY